MMTVMVESATSMAASATAARIFPGKSGHSPVDHARQDTGGSLPTSSEYSGTPARAVGSSRMKCRSLAGALKRALLFAGKEGDGSPRGGVMVGGGCVAGTDGASLVIIYAKEFELPMFFLPRRKAERLVDGYLCRCDTIRVDVRPAEIRIGAMTFPRLDAVDLRGVLGFESVSRVKMRSRVFTTALRLLATKVGRRALVTFEIVGHRLVMHSADPHGVARSAEAAVAVAGFGSGTMPFGTWRLDLLQRAVAAQPYLKTVKDLEISSDGHASLLFQWPSVNVVIVAGARA